MNRLIWIVLTGLLLAPTIARAQSDEVTYYHTDAISSVRMITDATGAVVARYDYLPFGELCESQCGAAPAPDLRQYAGKEREAEFKFDYFGARYLRAQSGRFLTVDPVINIEAALIDPQQWNRYTYAVNRPFVMVDPDGRNPVVVGGIIGAGVYAAWKAYVNVQTGQPWHSDIGVEAGKGFVVGATLGLAAPLVAGTTTAEIGVLTSTSATIAGPLGTIARGDLDRALNAGGRTIELVTKLTQSPTSGRALSAAAGEGAQSLAAASRNAGGLYSARIPEQALKMLERAGLVTVRITEMKGVQGIEYRFRPEAMEYLARYFEEVRQ